MLDRCSILYFCFRTLMTCSAVVWYPVLCEVGHMARIPSHAWCWAHVERLLQKLMPKTPEQTRKLE